MLGKLRRRFSHLRVFHPHYAEGWRKEMIYLLIGVYVCAAIGACFFSWEGLVLFFLLYAITGFGVTVGYHRYFTHQAFKTYKWVEWFLGISGALSGEGHALSWMLQHRKHHQHSDTEDDPHSPHFGGLMHAHVLWVLAFTSNEKLAPMYRKYVSKEEISDRFYVFLKRTYGRWHLGCIAVLAIGGWLYGCWHQGNWLYGGWYHALSFVGYGYFLRMIAVLNATWAVNSLAHRFGSRPFKDSVRDDSRNNWLVAIIALGEGWHNNHHASPTSYRHGIRWWQFDPSAAIIQCMWLVGLAWDLKPFRYPAAKTSSKVA